MHFTRVILEPEFLHAINFSYMTVRRSGPFVTPTPLHRPPRCESLVYLASNPFYTYKAQECAKDPKLFWNFCLSGPVGRRGGGRGGVLEYLRLEIAWPLLFLGLFFVGFLFCEL